MRVLCLLMFAAAVVHGQDLTPRQGSGWAGFKVGTKVRIKRTFLGAGRVPAVTISTVTLASVQRSVLTLVSVSKNPVGMEHKTTIVLPRSGEADTQEKATSKQLKNKVSFAAGKQFDCTRREITVTGAAGKRVITEWTSVGKPRMRVKRIVVTYDAAGKLTGHFSMVLAELPKERRIGKRKVTVLVYRTVHTAGKMQWRSRAVVSRDVPGYEVHVDAKVTVNGKRVQTIRVEVLDFEIK